MGLKLETIRDVYNALKRFGNGADNDFTKMAKILEQYLDSSD